MAKIHSIISRQDEEMIYPLERENRTTNDYIEYNIITNGVKVFDVITLSIEQRNSSQYREIYTRDNI